MNKTSALESSNFKKIFLFLIFISLFLTNNNLFSQIACGPINTLYQTVGNSGLGVTEVYRYNNFQQTYLKVGELEFSSNASATNSAYNAVTQYVYSSSGGSTIQVYDPANNYSFVGDINITGNSQNFTNVLFAQGNFIGFIRNNVVVQFDVTGIASYPATIPVIEVAIPGSSGPNDYALMGNEIYGVTATTLRIVNLTTNLVTNRTITFDNTLDGLNNQGTGFGACWQDRNGNFYFFSNTGGGIYKISNVINPASNVAVKILLANPSGQNDGFGCELGPDPLDFDEDGISDIDDLDDDNDGILDVNESGGIGIDPGGDLDGDAIYNFRDPDILGFVDVNGDTINDNFDSDLDGIPDAYDTDSDNDGCSDANEAYNNSNADGGDGEQYGVGDPLTFVGGGVLANGTVVTASYPGTNANVFTLGPDSDGDGITDICDPNVIDPCVPDPLNVPGADCDGDGVTNAQEITDVTDPLDDCSYVTASITLVVTSTADCDGDGVTNAQEDLDGTDGQDPCSFVLASQTVSTSPAWNSADCDGDGVTNAQEITDVTDPLDDCNFIPYNVTLPQSQDFLDGDCDEDGLSNEEEIGNDPTSPNDSNNNGIPDFLELNNNNPTIEDGIEVFQLVTPNGDGDNDVFVIRGIENFPNNTVEIYSRWGVKVYEKRGYGQGNNFFRGVSEGRVTINQSSELPVGTYYYILNYVNASGVSKTRTGYLYINR